VVGLDGDNPTIGALPPTMAFLSTLGAESSAKVKTWHVLIRASTRQTSAGKRKFVAEGILFP